MWDQDVQDREKLEPDIINFSPYSVTNLILGYQRKKGWIFLNPNIQPFIASDIMLLGQINIEPTGLNDEVSYAKGVICRASKAAV